MSFPHHHATPAFTAKFKKELFVGTALALVGGLAFRYWHLQIFKPTYHDWHTQYEQQTLARLEKKASALEHWEKVDLPLQQEFVTKTFLSYWNDPNIDQKLSRAESGEYFADAGEEEQDSE